MISAMGKDRDIGNWIRGLLSQATTAGADRIIVRDEEDHLSYEFQQARQLVFQSTTVGIALRDISPWIESRIPFVVTDTVPAYGVTVGGQLNTFKLVSTSRLRGGETLALSDFNRIPVEQSWNLLFGEGVVNPPWDRIESLKKGLVIVVSPNERHLRSSLGCILSRCDASSYGILSDSSPVPVVIDDASRALTVIGITGCDPVEALLRFRNKAFQMLLPEIAAVICMGFVPKICPDCARPTVVPPHILNQIPQFLKPDSFDSYKVGRGCDACGQSGHVGSMAVASFASVDAPLKELIHSGDAMSVVRYIHPRGGVPLVEGLLKLAELGITTFEGLELFSRTISSAFERWYSNKGGEIQGDWKKDESLPIPFDDEPEEKDDGFLLIVEDDSDQRQILRSVLEGSNYRVKDVEDGQEALVAMRHEIPRLIVCDLMMPNIDGTKLVEEVRADARLKHVPILILTVIADKEKEYSLLELGADDYCEKTIQRKILLKRIENLLRRSERPF